MCINSVKETRFSQKYQKWIYQVLEMSSSIVRIDTPLGRKLAPPITEIGAMIRMLPSGVQRVQVCTLRVTQNKGCKFAT